MCSSTYARGKKVYFKPWQQTRIVWKISWKLLLLLVEQGVKKHLVLLCLDTWLSFALAAAVLQPGMMLGMAELILGTPSPLLFPTNPWTRWDSSEGSHTFLVSL